MDGVVNVRNFRLTFTTLGLVANIRLRAFRFSAAVVVASADALFPIILFTHGAISVRSSVIVFVRSMPAIKIRVASKCLHAKKN